MGGPVGRTAARRRRRRWAADVRPPGLPAGRCAESGTRWSPDAARAHGPAGPCPRGAWAGRARLPSAVSGARCPSPRGRSDGRQDAARPGAVVDRDTGVRARVYTGRPTDPVPPRRNGHGRQDGFTRPGGSGESSSGRGFHGPRKPSRQP